MPVELLLSIHCLFSLSFLCIIKVNEKCQSEMKINWAQTYATFSTRIEEIYAHVVHTMPIIAAKKIRKKNFFSLMAIRGRFEILFVFFCYYKIK